MLMIFQKSIKPIIDFHQNDSKNPLFKYNSKL